MTLIFDLYWSFRSPYSYLVTDRIVAFQNDFDVCCNVRPVYPIAVRQPEFFANSDPLWFSYFARDIHRSAQFAGIPFRWANPDPVFMDPATRTYPKEQPHIHRDRAPPHGVTSQRKPRRSPALPELIMRRVLPIA